MKSCIICEKQMGNKNFKKISENDEKYEVFHYENRNYSYNLSKKRVFHIFLHGKIVETGMWKTNICGKVEK